MQFNVFKDFEWNGDYSWVQFEPDKRMEHDIKLVVEFNKQNGNAYRPYIPSFISCEQS